MPKSDHRCSWTGPAITKGNGKVFNARSLPWRIYYHCSWSQLLTTCSNATEIARWAVPSCNRPLLATDHGVRDGRSNWLAVTPTRNRAVSPQRHLQIQIKRVVRGFDPGTGTPCRPPHGLCGHSGYIEEHPANRRNRKPRAVYAWQLLFYFYCWPCVSIFPFIKWCEGGLIQATAELRWRLRDNGSERVESPGTYVTEWVSLGHFCLVLCSFGPPSRAVLVITWSGKGCRYMMRLG